MKKNKLLIPVGIAALVVLIGLFGLIYHWNAQKPSEGVKTLTIEVVDDKQNTASYEVHTDAEYLHQALDETEGLTIEGEESSYGFSVLTVNGLTADFNTGNAYWAFYVDGEFCNYGVDTQPVNDGEVYSIIYSTY